MTLNAMTFNAYIGPRHVATDDPTAFGHWSWVQELYDLPAPPLRYMGQMSLTATVGSGNLTITISGGTGIPNGGGLWVGPNAVGEGWEYMPYYKSGAIINVQRTIPEGQNGFHTSGAPVYLWYPLQNNNGVVQYDEELSENTATVTWTAKLSGVAAPASILKPEHLLVVTIATPPYSLAENQHHQYFVGLVERVSMSQDFNMQGTWEIDITSSARLLQVSQVPALRLGPLDVGVQAQATASSSLGANWKLIYPQLEEIKTGARPELDIVELQVDCEPSNITDGNEDTVWVSDGWLGARAAYANTKDKKAWMSLFVVPPPVDFYGCKYIEIINTDNMDNSWLYIFSKWKDTAGVYHKRWFQGGNSDTFAKYGGMDDTTISKPDLRMVIAEDASVFKRIFPAAKPTTLIDASTLVPKDDLGTNIELVRRVWWEGGAIFLRWVLGGSSGRDSLVSWGDVTLTELQDEWAISGTGDFSFPGRDAHIAYGPFDGTKPVILPGQVFRRDLLEGTAVTHAYTVDYVHAPGYQIADQRTDDDPDDHPSVGVEYLIFKLPEMSHFLFEDIALGTTSIRVVDSQQHPNVEGLSLHQTTPGFGSGFIIIDTELIPYTGKDYKTGTLTGCTVNNTHKAGARVYVRWNVNAYGRGNAFNIVAVDADERKPMQGASFRIASCAYPLAGLEWGRGKFRAAPHADRHPYLKNFTWWFSLDEDPPAPTEPFFPNGYLGTLIDSTASGYPHSAAGVPNASIDLTHSHFAEVSGDGFRPKSMMLDMRAMANAAATIITARPMLNYMRCLVDRRYYNPETWLDAGDYGSGYNNEVQIQALMRLSGQDAGFFGTGGSGLFARGARKIGVTEAGNAWQIASDMADYGSSLIRAQRNSVILITQNPFLLSATHTPVKTFTRTEIMSLETVNVRPSEVAQVRLTWEDPNTKVKGMVFYPPTNLMRPGGTIVDVGPMLADDDADAQILCTNLYRMKRFAYNVFVELDLSDVDFEIQCGHIHQVQYDFLGNKQPFIKHLMVETVSRTLQDGTLRLQLGYREIDRESY